MLRGSGTADGWASARAGTASAPIGTASATAGTSRPWDAGEALARVARLTPASRGLLAPAVAEAVPMGADAVPALAEAQPSAVPEPLSIKPVPAQPVPDRALVP